MIGNLHYISSYDDPDSVDPDHRVIDSFGTFDATVMMKLTDSIDAFVTGFNLLGRRRRWSIRKGRTTASRTIPRGGGSRPG